MNVLLTGATGLLGNNTLRALLSEGHRVMCLLRTHDKPPALADLDVELVYGDLADSESLVTASIPDFDAMIHCAALIH
ncbi:MAG TPA: NAD-dependent epimerase/dehydratase family protein, partial [Pirellulaceae bacterium]|nr:NAD-dependent epimerase/dehydratase family protein [Pirellulaceae bacterium]